MANRAAGEHKQRITNHVIIDELRLRDEKTGVSLLYQFCLRYATNKKCFPGRWERRRPKGVLTTIHLEIRSPNSQRWVVFDIKSLLK
jgi:hypothetical protein